MNVRLDPVGNVSFALQFTILFQLILGAQVVLYNYSDKKGREIDLSYFYGLFLKTSTARIAPTIAIAAIIPIAA